jgi:hypothetical protein
MTPTKETQRDAEKLKLVLDLSLPGSPLPSFAA